MCPPASGIKVASPRGGKPQKQTKRRPRKRSTDQARTRAEGLIDPNVGVVAKDPLRVQILSIAVSRMIAASEFAREAEIPLNIASYHFRVLREAGFLEIVKEETIRGSTVKKYHKATKSGFISDADWGEVKDALRPGVAGAILSDFNGRVSEAIDTKTLFTRDDACLFWAPRTYDEMAYGEQVKMIAWCIEESERLELETVERRASGESGEGDCMNVTFAIAGFLSPTPDEVKKAARRKSKSKRKRKQSDGRQALKKPKRKQGMKK
jgi:DNA-binding transcriptional ArsR family regulator